MLTPPITAKKPTERSHHGDVVTDDYEWLRDKDDPAVIAHLHEENAYTNARTEALGVLREQIFDEIKHPRGRLVVLHAHGRGPAVRHPLPRSDRRT